VKSLVFRELWILSKAEKAGINLSLSPNVNLLIGENDVGKSTLIKSFYHCLGADTPQINNAVWRRANPIYCVKFEIGEKEYHIVRDEKYFGVFDGGKKLISRHVGVGGKNGIAKFINKLLDFDVELERQADGKLGFAGPAFYFLPFYVDQDEGWSTSWSSFVGLKQFSNYRRLMLDYHLGVRPQTYYDAKKREIELQEQLATAQGERLSMQAARNSVEKRKVRTQVDLDPAAFRAELESVVDQYNGIYGQQQGVLSRIKDFRNQRNAVDTELEILRKAIGELDADYRYSESPETPDVVGCPTCGTEFCNSFTERFGILDDIDHCHALVDQWLKKRSEITIQLEQVEDEYKQVSAQLKEVEATLARTKENVTLSELIASEGMKEMISSLNGDIQEMLTREEGINSKISKNADGLKVDGARKNKIVTWYKARMKEYLNALNVGVLSEDDYKSLDNQIKNNALGSDLPRALLAQYFAFLSTMNEFNSFVLSPMLIDSPFQQEQDPTNKKAILDFILSKKLKGQQMILATISVDEFSDSSELENTVMHKLDNKLSVLRQDLYQAVLTDIGDMHGDALASPD
jgi:energy-coupling factor transporter ATP-binding protein EcfA2